MRSSADKDEAASSAGRCFVIVGGGDLTPAFLKERLETYPDAFVVAADKGIEVLEAAGRQPDHLMGDFDSVDPAALQDARAALSNGRTGEVVDVFPAEKDFTDTEAAIRFALERGAKEIVLLGMTGGRLDHFLANLHNMLLPLEAGIPCVMEDPQNRISLIAGGEKRSLEKDKAFGTYLSLIPITDDLKGLTLRGVKYPLEGANVRKGVSLCVSNEIIAEKAVLELREGIAAVILSADKP